MFHKEVLQWLCGSQAAVAPMEPAQPAQPWYPVCGQCAGYLQLVGIRAD